ncbi:MAG: 50S ribosomal protein L9 [Deltaproteobacteria bacterium]|jgi:large subunit ribosomal protein L9|nr:MAG: 50S ribosomal protein L9 [Deltaproteobacteria bacterium]
MKVILQEDVDTLGKAGDIVKVADGYGRNYLIPKRLAVPADVRNLRALEHDRRVIEARSKKVRRSAEEMGGRLSSLSLTIPAKAGEEGKLFGAVTSRDIAEALERAGVAVDRRMVLLEEPIKQVGDYKVKIKAGTDIVPEVSVRVVAE